MKKGEVLMYFQIVSAQRCDKEIRRLLHDQAILYGFNSLDAFGDFIRFADGVLRIDEAAQLYLAFVSLDTYFEGLEKIVFRKQSFNLGRDNRIVNIFTCTFMFGRCRISRESSDKRENEQTANNKDTFLFHNEYTSLGWIFL
jgi:hypothetical protein